MAIDIGLLVFLCFGFYKGFSKGLIIAVFSAIGWALGIIGALHLMDTGTAYLQKTLNSHSVYLPFLSFILIFIAIFIIIHLLGKLLEKIIDIAQLGIANKISGGILIAAVYFFIFGLLVWICNHAGFISPAMKEQSKSYNLVEMVSEQSKDRVSSVFPSLKETYGHIEALFDKAAKNAQGHG